MREAQESRVPASQKSHIPSPADLGLEWHDSEETSGSNRIVFQPSVDEKVLIDDGVINKFDIRKLRMALMVLAESGTDMSGLVFIAPGNSSPVRERNRYLFIERSFHKKNELITLVKRYVKRSHFMDDGMRVFNQTVKDSSGRYLIEESAMSWLKDKKAACWAWCYIKNKNKPIPLPPSQYSQESFSIHSSAFISPRNIPADIPSFYSETGISDPELTSKGLLEAITAFFDHWLVERHIKYEESDKFRNMWEALNQRAEIKKTFRVP